MSSETARPAIAAAPSHPAGTDGVTLRRVEALAEYDECIAIQRETWGPTFHELVPPSILLSAQKVGGVCAAAFASSGRMLGFVFGMTGVRDGRLVHWSDMLAVRPEARGQHLGERLKHFQRDLVRPIGVETMYWTFDPLVARNAHLNLNRLGARAIEYVPNMYGSDTGSPLHGALPTDRFVTAWDLTRGPEANNGTGRASASAATAGVLVTPTDASGLPAFEFFRGAPVIHIAIPREFDAEPPDRRALWRAVTREAFLAYLTAGYEVAGFRRGQGSAPPRYELTPKT